MSEIEQHLREIAKNTRKANGCCYNSTEHIKLTAGGTDTKVFAVNSFHSLAFLVDTGGTVDISYDSDPAIEYTTAGTDTNDTLNKRVVTFVATAGSTTIMWKY